MFGLTILFGTLVGFALGLTGGGGGVFAVPLLVYGLSVAPRVAVGVSLASVGGTALLGVVPRMARGEVEWSTGLLFAIAGMLGAPIGSYCSGLIPEYLLLLLFALLMLVVAWRMWVKSRHVPTRQNASHAAGDEPVSPEAETCEPETCQRDSEGQLRLTSSCAVLLAAVGLATGFLSGMFGIGGGFVIVPALVLFSGMHMHRAVASSLLVIVLISISGVTSYVSAGNELPWNIALQFLVGGFLGMLLGAMIAKRLTATTLQQVFAVAVVLVAMFVISQSILGIG